MTPQLRAALLQLADAAREFALSINLDEASWAAMSPEQAALLDAVHDVEHHATVS